MKKRSHKEELEAIWVRTRDALDAIRAREQKALAKKHMGDCFMDVQYERGEPEPGRGITRTPSVYSYYKVIGAEDGNIIYFMLHLQTNGLMQIEPRHHSGRYVIDYYTPLDRGLFNLRYNQLVKELQTLAPTS